MLSPLRIQCLVFSFRVMGWLARPCWLPPGFRARSRAQRFISWLLALFATVCVSPTLGVGLFPCQCTMLVWRSTGADFGYSLLPVVSLITLAREAWEKDPLDNGEWVTHSKMMRSKLSLRPGSYPWSEHASEPRLRHVPRSARVHELINVAWGSRPAPQRTFPWFADLSQCISRRPWGSSMGCLTTSSHPYDFSNDLCMNGNCKLLLQGLLVCDKPLFAGVSEAARNDLAGEGMFAPSITTITLAICLNNLAPWWRPLSSSG